MNARQLKMVTLCWLRFQKKFPFVATEAGYYNADVVGANDKHLYEVEVKTNCKDFLADFKKGKHRIYAEVSQSKKKIQRQWIPNKFYFIVPESMVEFATKELENYPDYGLLTVKWSKWWNNPEIQTIKIGRFLHRQVPLEKTISRLIQRMSSEVIGHLIRMESQDRSHDHMTDLVKKLVRVENKRKKK